MVPRIPGRIMPPSRPHHGAVCHQEAASGATVEGGADPEDAEGAAQVDGLLRGEHQDLPLRRPLRGARGAGETDTTGRVHR